MTKLLLFVVRGGDRYENETRELTVKERENEDDWRPRQGGRSRVKTWRGYKEERVKVDL